VGPVYEVILALVRNVRNGSFVDFGMSAASPVHPGNTAAPVLPVEGIGLDVIQSALAACQ
jgi:hypothetical protein